MSIDTKILVYCMYIDTIILVYCANYKRLREMLNEEIEHKNNLFVRLLSEVTSDITKNPLRCQTICNWVMMK